MKDEGPSASTRGIDDEVEPITIRVIAGFVYGFGPSRRKPARPPRHRPTLRFTLICDLDCIGLPETALYKILVLKGFLAADLDFAGLSWI
jgi:hypothetical protein